MDKVSKKQISKRTEQEKLDLIDQWEKSGQPIKTFCDQHDFSDSVFHTWLNKYRRGKRSAKQYKGFVPLHVTSNAFINEDNRVFAEIIMVSGTRIKLY